MKRYPVNDNNLLSVGYDEVNQILEIEFKLNVIYHYYEVPIDEFVAMMKAESIEEFYFNFVQCKYHFGFF